MSKKLIAGAGVVASFAVALAPLATFADTVSPSDQHTDQLVLTVLPSCAFGSPTTRQNIDGVGHDNGTGDYAASATTSGTEYNISATVWNETTQATSDASGALHDGSGNTEDHNTGDIDSTGYGILVGEGGVSATNGLANPSEHTVHRSMLAGTKTDTFAQTTLTVVCNNGGGYSITALATALTNGTTGEDIPVTTDYSATASGYALKTLAVEASNGMSLATSGDPATAVTTVAPTSETILASKNGVSKDAGDTLTITYGVGVKPSQKAATYAGTVTYKLYKGVNGAGA